MENVRALNRPGRARTVDLANLGIVTRRRDDLDGGCIRRDVVAGGVENLYLRQFEPARLVSGVVSGGRPLDDKLGSFCARCSGSCQALAGVRVLQGNGMTYSEPFSTDIQLEGRHRATNRGKPLFRRAGQLQGNPSGVARIRILRAEAGRVGDEDDADGDRSPAVRDNGGVAAEALIVCGVPEKSVHELT